MYYRDVVFYHDTVRDYDLSFHARAKPESSPQERRLLISDHFLIPIIPERAWRGVRKIHVSQGLIKISNYYKSLIRVIGLIATLRMNKFQRLN